MTMDRTQAEIVERINQRTPEDFFGFETSEYLGYLTFDNAKQFLKEEANRKEWEAAPTLKEPEFYIKDYMEFAWEKANNKRGLSAGRSIAHMVAWLWLAGEDDLAEWCNDDSNYYHYGKPILQKICEHYEIDWKQWDDGERSNS